MDKLTYLAKTLSRTNRKDYENFVINAIWNRLGRDDIQPVSQQYVRNHADARRFIDLYFPQLNIGIECDEGHHQRQAKADGNAKPNSSTSSRPSRPETTLRIMYAFAERAATRTTTSHCRISREPLRRSRTRLPSSRAMGS